MRKDIIMKRKRCLMLVVTVLCCTVMVSVWGLRAAAASSTVSVENISADNGRMAFSSETIKSRGNLEFGTGEMSINASDMDHLQSAMKELFDKLPSVIGGDASSVGTARREGIRSKGIIDYSNGTVVLDSSDFVFLADEIDSLEFEYKANTVAALNDIGTYFKSDGSITHNQGEETLPFQYAANLSIGSICGGVLQSQSVDHLTAAPATADNISEGAAAWVNGQCIVGNGNDVKAAYDQGELAGYERGQSEGYQNGYNEGKSDGYDAGYKQGDSDGYERGKNEISIKSGTYTWVWDTHSLDTANSDRYLRMNNESISYNTGQENLIACTITEISGVRAQGFAAANSNSYVPIGLTTSCDNSGNIYLNVAAGTTITNQTGTGWEDYGTATITVTYYYF